MRFTYLDSSGSSGGSWLLGGSSLGLLHILGSTDGLLTLSFAHFWLLVSLLHDVLESGTSDGTSELGQLARLLLSLSLDLCNKRCMPFRYRLKMVKLMVKRS